MMQDTLKSRILVIGCPGSGKSCFARRLRELTGLPLTYLDLLFHRPDRTTVSRADFDRQLQAVLVQERWIIDGNYLRTLPLRLDAAEQVFLFDLPLEDCLAGAAARIGTKREDLPWVEEEFDAAFRQYILDFPRDQLPVILDLLSARGGGKSLVTFRSRAEADRYLDSINTKEAAHETT